MEDVSSTLQSTRGQWIEGEKKQILDNVLYFEKKDTGSMLPIDVERFRADERADIAKDIMTIVGRRLLGETCISLANPKAFHKRDYNNFKFFYVVREVDEKMPKLVMFMEKYDEGLLNRFIAIDHHGPIDIAIKDMYFADKKALTSKLNTIYGKYFFCLLSDMEELHYEFCCTDEYISHIEICRIYL